MSDQPRLDPAAMTTEEEVEVRRDLRFLVRGGLILLVVGFVAFAVIAQVGKLPTDRLRFAPGWLLFSALGFVLFQLAAADAWRRMLRALGDRLRVVRGQAIWNTSNLARYVPTSLLLIVVRIRMSEHAGATRERTAASLVYEIPLTLSGALCVGAWFLIQLPQLEHHAVLRYLPIALVAVAICTLHPRVFHPIGDRLLARLGRPPLERTMSFPRVLAFVAFYAAGFVLAGLATYAFAMGIYRVHPSDLPVVAGAFAVGYVVSIFGFVLPGGLGAREAAFSAALAPVLPTTIALAVAVGVRLLQMAIEVLLAAVTPLLARYVEVRRNASVSASDAGVPIS